MYRIITFIIYLNMILFSFKSTAQGNNNEVLNNEKIIALIKGGLNKNLIILKIENSESNFDLSTESLLKLKSSLVDDEIVEAMMKKAAKSNAKGGKINSESGYSSNDEMKNSKTEKNKIDSTFLEKKNMAKIIFNGKEYEIKRITARLDEDGKDNWFGMRIQTNRYLNITWELKNTSSSTLYINMTNMLFSGKKVEPQSFYFRKVTGYNSNDPSTGAEILDNQRNFIYLMYAQNNEGLNGKYIFTKKLGNSNLKVTKFNLLERTFSGEFKIDAFTFDDSPVSINGYFNNISYDIPTTF